MSALQRADRELSGFAGRIGGGMERVGRSMTTLGAAMAPVSLALAGIGTVGVRTASQFDSLMAEIAARTGATGEEMARLSDFALQMGADTSFSAQQAGEAFLQLLSSGQTMEQAIATLPAVLDAAAASGESLGATADIVTDIMAAFGLGVDQAGTVVDALSQAAGASSADMASLGQGFGNVGPIAAMMGLSVGETAAALAVLSENGIKGAEAGTALKSVLRQLGTNPDALAMLDELGISFYDAEGNARQFDSVLDDISAALSDASDDERTAIINELGGAYGMTALQALLLSGGIDTMLGAMDGSASAADVAAARMDTFAGAVDTLKGSVETLNITAFTPFMNDTLKPLAKRVTAGVNAMTTLARLNPGLTSTVIKLGAAFVGATTALLGIGTALTLMGPALPIVAAGLGLILSPVALIGAGLAVAAWFAYDFADSMGWLDRGLATIQHGLNLFRIGLEPLTKGGAMDMHWITRGLEYVKTGVKQMGTDILQGIRDSVFAATGIDLAPIGQSISDKLAALRVTAAGLRDRAAAALAAAFDALPVPDLSGVGSALRGALNRLFVTEVLPNGMVVRTGGLSFGGLAAGLGTAIANAIRDVDVPSFDELRTRVSDGLRRALTTAMNVDLRGAAMGVRASLMNLFSGAQTLPNGMVVGGGLLAGLGAALQAAVDALPAPSISGLRDTIVGAVNAALTNVSGITLTGIGAAVQTAINTDVEGVDLSGARTSLATALDTSLSDAVSIGLAGAGFLIGGPIGSALGIARLVVSAVENDFLGIGTFLQQSGILPAAERAFATLKGQIDGLLSSIFGGDGAAGEGMGGPASMFRSEGGGIGAALTGFFEGLQNIQLPDLSGIETFLRAGLQPIVDAIQGLASNPALQSGLSSLSSGITGFFAAFATMDTSGLDNIGQVLTVVANAVGNLVGGLIQVGGSTLGAFLSAIGDALPVIGQGLADVLGAFSIAAETGDVGAAFRGLNEGLNGIGRALAGIALDTLTGLASAIGDLLGIDVEGGLAAWGPALENMAAAVAVVLDNVKLGMERWTLEVREDILSWVSDLRADILQATGGGVDIAPTVDVQLAAIQIDLGEFDVAAEFGRVIGAQLASGEIDLSQRLLFSDASGALVAQSLVDLVANPDIAERISQATILQIQGAINTAAMNGDVGTYEALLPLATALDIPIEPMIADLNTALLDATDTPFAATMYADVTVMPNSVNLDPVAAAITARMATLPRMSSGGGGAPPVPMQQHAHGGLAAYTGPHWLERGERVLTVGESRFSGRGGGGNTYIINAYGSSPYELADMVARAERSKGGGI